MKRVIILGGGIGGLAAAHSLLQAGVQPIVLEATGQLGGLGTHFDHENIPLDRFYHVLLDTDHDLRALLDELGLRDSVVWQETGMGFLVDGRLYPFNTPIDLLRFGALNPIDRLRTGFGALYITALKKNGLDLDGVRAVDWLPRIFGPRVFAKIWDPLLRAKFGDRRDRVPAYWVWNTLNREKNGSQKIKGYVRGGYHTIVEALRGAIERAGGEIRLDTRVEALDADETGARVRAAGIDLQGDAVIVTTPLPILRSIAAPKLAADLPLERLEYQGVVNALLLLRRRLSPFYWTAVVDSRFPFQGVVETTHVVPLDWTGGRHLVYALNYCAADSEIYRRSDETVAKQATEGLLLLYPDLRREEIETVYVFRAPHVEPVWTTGYLSARPKPRIANRRAYLCTTAQAYPRVTAWNTSVGLARETVQTLLADLDRPAAAAA